MEKTTITFDEFIEKLTDSYAIEVEGTLTFTYIDVDEETGDFSFTPGDDTITFSQKYNTEIKSRNMTYILNTDQGEIEIRTLQLT
jgi:hypothetical protein